MRVVLDENFRNWILGAVVRESASKLTRKVAIQYVSTSRRRHPFRFLGIKYLRKLRLDPGDLVINHRTLNFLVTNGVINPETLSTIRCHFTHESETLLGVTDTLKNLSKVSQVLVLNSRDREKLIQSGIQSNRIVVIYGAIDRALFKPSPCLPVREFVFLSGDAKGRKNPSKVIDLIAKSPDLEFVICGRGWENYLLDKGLKNLELHQFNLDLNAQLIRDASAYLTLSLEEGGPYPVLEALASGTPVVSTPVGWVPEILTASNGVVIPFEADVEQIRAALTKAIKLKSRTHHIDLLQGRFTWEEQASLLFRQQK